MYNIDFNIVLVLFKLCVVQMVPKRKVWVSTLDNGFSLVYVFKSFQNKYNL